jgi:outer membrane lipoprotein-sorting protein
MMETQGRRDAAKNRSEMSPLSTVRIRLLAAASSASLRLCVSKGQSAGQPCRFHRALLAALSLVALLFSSAAATAQQLTADDEKALLARLREQRSQFPALTADFTEERTTHLLKKPIRSTGTIAFHAPNKFRRDLRGQSPSLTVCNGTELWIHYPAFKEAEHYTLGRKQFFDDSLAALTAGLNFHDVDRFFRIAPAREGTGYRIVLTPKSGSLRRLLTSLTVWMNADAIVEKTDATLPKGDRISTTYRNVRALKNVDVKFDFTPPSDAHVSTPLGD